MDRSYRTIKIFDVVGGEAAITDTDGKLVYDKIDAFLSENVNVVLDFANVQFIITVFLNAAIGQLYKKYTSEQLNLNLKIINLSKDENKHVQEVVDYAKKFFNEPEKEKDVERNIKEVLGHE
jgi:hypothetical protein